MEMGEGGYLLGHGIGMGVNRLHRHQRAEALGLLKDDLGNEPRIDQRVIRVDEDSCVSKLLAPAGDVGYSLLVGAFSTALDWGQVEKTSTGMPYSDGLERSGSALINILPSRKRVVS